MSAIAQKTLYAFVCLIKNNKLVLNFKGFSTIWPPQIMNNKLLVDWCPTFFFLVTDMLWEISSAVSILTLLNFALGLHLSKCFELGIQGQIRAQRAKLWHITIPITLGFYSFINFLSIFFVAKDLF